MHTPEAEPIAPHTTVPRRWRLLALALVLCMAAGLQMGGAQPVAVGLFSANWDKLAHLLTFAVIGAASGLASGQRGMALLLSALVGALAVGGLDEWHQGRLPGRSASWGDLLADALGALLGAALLQWAYARQQRARQPGPPTCPRSH